MLIVIDGYNYIFTIPEIEKHAKAKQIESVRNHIILLFSRYKEKKSHEIIIVFDGNYTSANLPKKQTHYGITVIYSRTGVSADTEIKNITSCCQNPNDVFIVTYDNDIKRHVKKCGCQIIEPKTLHKEIIEILCEDEKIKSDEPDSKLAGPSEADSQYWKTIFKEIPNEEFEIIFKKPSTPAINKKKNKQRLIAEESICKYHPPSPDEAQHWIRIFTEIENNEQKD